MAPFRSVFLLLAVVGLAGCSGDATPTLAERTAGPTPTVAAPTQRSTPAVASAPVVPSADAPRHAAPSQPASSPLDGPASGTYGCYVFVPSIGTGSTNITGIYAHSSFLGQFRIVDEATYLGFFNSRDGGAYAIREDAIIFTDGPLQGLAGVYGQFDRRPRIVLVGTSNGWEDLHLDCQATGS